MTNQQHPITPPPELVQQWRNLPEYASQLRTVSTVTITTEKLQDIATQAARWGADQELEACCKWVANTCPLGTAKNLCLARRPKPPSLKEQSLALIDKIQGNKDPWDIRDLDVVRRALEEFDD